MPVNGSSGAQRPTPRSRSTSAPRLASARRTSASRSHTAARPTRSAGSPTSAPARRRAAHARTADTTRTASRPHNGPRTAPGASILQQVLEVASKGITALIGLLSALVALIGSGIGNLVQRYQNRAATNPRSHSHAAPQRLGNAPRRQQAGPYASRAPRGAQGRPAAAAAIPGIQDIISLPKLAGALAAVIMASAVFFVPAAGISPEIEIPMLDMPARNAAQLPASTPRSSWTQGEMPYLYQIDPAWSLKPYGGGTVRDNGCATTCMTMVYVYLTGSTAYNPGSMSAFSDAGGYCPTGATEWRFMTEGAASLGITGKQVSLSRSAITQALEEGKPVICSMAPGDFTVLGHFIVLSGIDENGMVTVHDPNSSARSARKWGIVEVLSQMKAAWAFNLS